MNSSLVALIQIITIFPFYKKGAIKKQVEKEFSFQAPPVPFEYDPDSNCDTSTFGIVTGSQALTKNQRKKNKKLIKKKNAALMSQIENGTTETANTTNQKLHNLTGNAEEASAAAQARLSRLEALLGLHARRKDEPAIPLNNQHPIPLPPPPPSTPPPPPPLESALNLNQKASATATATLVSSKTNNKKKKKNNNKSETLAAQPATTNRKTTSTIAPLIETLKPKSNIQEKPSPPPPPPPPE